MQPIITIPKPCHENWTNMTPDERGAFCTVCSKSVWDFTNRTPEEIQHILTQERDKKVCGRFRSDQLAQPVDVHVPLHVLLQQAMPRMSRFALAAFVVFGASLFSFISVQGQVLGKVRIDVPRSMIGEIQIQVPVQQAPPPQPGHYLGRLAAPTVVDTPDTEPMIMGGIKPVDAHTTPDTVTYENLYLTGDTIVYEPEQLLGELFVEDIRDTRQLSMRLTRRRCN